MTWRAQCCKIWFLFSKVWSQYKIETRNSLNQDEEFFFIFLTRERERERELDLKVVDTILRLVRIGISEGCGFSLVCESRGTGGKLQVWSKLKRAPGAHLQDK